MGGVSVHAASYTSDSDYGNSYYQYSHLYDRHNTYRPPYSYSYDRNRDARIEALIEQLNDLLDELERMRNNHDDYYYNDHYYYGRDSYPDVNTDNADNIGRERAELQGSVDMRDFDNGLVFFVYGEDEEKIQDVERDYETYADIEEDGGDLQKVRVATGLDDMEDYTYTIRNLNRNTEYFFSMCVAFKDENNDKTIRCGDVERFETD